jgi:hypothetical protein
MVNHRGMRKVLSVRLLNGSVFHEVDIGCGMTHFVAPYKLRLPDNFVDFVTRTRGG